MLGNCVILSVMSAGLCLTAAWDGPRQITVERLDAKPEINGDLSDKCWGSQPWRGDFSILESGARPEAQTRFKVFHDGLTLYFGVECDEPFTDRIVSKTDAVRDSALRWTDDCAEITLVPDNTGVTLYKAVISTKGRATCLKLLDSNTGKETFNGFEWESGLRAAAKVSDGKWTLEAAFPVAAMDLSRNTAPVWKFSVGRNRYAGEKPELSVFSPINSGSTSTPSQFGSAELKDFNPALFNWELSGLEGRTVSGAGGLCFQLEPVVFNRSGEFRIFQLRAALQKDGAEQSSAKAVSSLRDNRSRPVALSLPIREAFQGAIRFDLMTADGGLLKILTAPADTAYQPLRLTVRQPCYRNNIYASMPVNEIIADVTCAAAVSHVRAELTGPDGFSRRADASPRGKGFTVKMRADDLKEGKYTLTVQGETEDGKELSVSEAIPKLPPHSGEVCVDSSGAIRNNGKPFLPFGWFYPEEIKKESGFTVVHTYSRFESLKAAAGFLDRANEAGLKVILYPYQEFSGQWEQKIFDNKKHRQGFLSDEQARMIKNFVRGVMSHPAIFGWYMSDEPEGFDENPEWHRQVYGLIRETDPFHPCIMLNYGTEGMRKYYQACDILMPDCYPIFVKGGEPRKPLWSTSKWTRTALELQRPVMLVIQAYCEQLGGKVNGVELPGRAPDFEELRNQFYQIFANNGKGSLLYAQADWAMMYYPLRLGPSWLAGEAALIKDFLLADNEKNSLVFTTQPEDPHFQAALKKTGGGICVIAVNTSNRDIKASF